MLQMAVYIGGSILFVLEHHIILFNGHLTVERKHQGLMDKIAKQGNYIQ